MRFGTSPRLLLPALLLVIAAAAASAGADTGARRARLEDQLAASRAAGDRTAEAETLRDLAALVADAGDLAGAAVFYAELIEAAANAGDTRLEAVGEEGVGMAHAAAARHDEALAAFERAVALYRAAGDDEGERRTFYRLGRRYFDSSNFAHAEDLFNLAIELAERAGDVNIEAEAANLLAATYGRTGRPEEALDSYLRALDGYRRLGARRAAARVLQNVVSEYINQARTLEALEAATELLAEAEALDDDTLRALARLSLGRAYTDTGRPREALVHLAEASRLGAGVEGFAYAGYVEFSTATAHGYLADHPSAISAYERSLELARVRGDRFLEAAALQAMAYAEQQLGRYEEALDHLFTSLELRREIGDQMGVAGSHHGLALVFGTLSDHERALEEFGKAIEIQRRASYPEALLGTLQNLAAALYYQDRFDEALAVLEEAAQGLDGSTDPRRWAENHSLRGWVLTDQGRPDEAIVLLEQAASLQRNSEDPFGLNRTLVGLGRAHLLAGRLDDADSALGEALLRSHMVGDWINAIGAREKLARVERARGRPHEARAHFLAALEQIEGQRSGLASEELRSLFFGGHRHYFESYLDLLFDLHRSSPGAGFDREALHVAERARARSLLDLVLTGKIEAGGSVDPELARRERELALEVADVERRLSYLASRGADGEEIARVQERRDALASQLKDLETRLWARDPRYAALSFPRPLDAAGVQELLPERTLLLEYALGETRSYLWAVSRRRVELFELPERAEIERLAHRLHSTLQASHGRAERGAAEIALRQVSAMLLGPLADLEGVDRLLVVADGALHYLPFGALRGPGSGAAPLLERVEVVQLPSASVLGGLRERAGRGFDSPRIAVIADPVFRLDDPRVAPLDGTQTVRLTEAEAEVVRAAGLGELRRLAHTRREAETIGGLAAPRDLLLAVDFDANKTLVQGDRLRQFSVVHFATHGLLNDRNPDLSGLVLSLVDADGRPRDGFLRAGEIYDLDLPLDLVVLSACRTGLGREIEGEGLVGLTRAFLHAGARRVVVSLWSVSDAATAELMSHFYRGLLRDRLPPAAALRAAQRALRAERRWQAPYYWAGFVLQGDWR